MTDAAEKEMQRRIYDLERRVGALEMYLVSLCNVISKSTTTDVATRQSANAVKVTIERSLA